MGMKAKKSTLKTLAVSVMTFLRVGGNAIIGITEGKDVTICDGME